MFAKIGRLAVAWFWYARVRGILAGIPHDIWGGLGTSVAVPHNVVRHIDR